MLADVTNPFFAELLRGAREASLACGKTLLMLDAHESASAERSMIEHAIGAVDGVIMSASRMNDSALRMVAKQLPLVVLNRRVVGLPSFTVDVDIGIRQALDHLVRLGHRRAVYVAGPEALQPGDVERRCGLAGC